MTEKLDGVIVCGAGPVGLVTALKLARMGVPVTVLDAAAQIADEPRAVVYHAPVVRELDRLGLLDDLRK
ncbi:MAG: FAD-dependent monooxygenase, partial [Caulobacteraceae bacterium]